MIYKLKDEEGYVISSNNCWHPGVYDSEKTARYAFKFKDEDLENLMVKNNYSNIKFEDLQELYKTRKDKLEI